MRCQTCREHIAKGIFIEIINPHLIQSTATEYSPNIEYFCDGKCLTMELQRLKSLEYTR